MDPAAIPFARLGISREFRVYLAPDARREDRLAAARGTLPVGPEAQLGICYSLTGDPDREVREAARRTVLELPARQVVEALHQESHPKLLEYVAALRGDDQDIATRIYGIRNANDRTAVLLAERAGPSLCERIVDNHERLLMTPQVLLALKRNPQCSDALWERAATFLRMHRMVPEEPAESAGVEMDLDQEVEAALSGSASPALAHRAVKRMELFDLDGVGGESDPLAGFTFDFDDESSAFSLDLVEERQDVSQDERLSLEKRVSGFAVGQKIRLAYVGNKEVRQILLRDRNQMVAVAVIKSGRCTDGEIVGLASNRNIHDDVLREVARNREWTRKYQVKVALVNNPKTPVSVAVGLVSHLQKRDLQELSRNHNVSSVVATVATRLFKQKFKGGGEGQQR